MTQICFGHRAHPVASGPSVRVALTLRPVLTLEVLHLHAQGAFFL